MHLILPGNETYTRQIRMSSPSAKQSTALSINLRLIRVVCFGNYRETERVKNKAEREKERGSYGEEDVQGGNWWSCSRGMCWASCLAKVKVIKYAHKYATQKCSKKIKPERERKRRRGIEEREREHPLRATQFEFLIKSNNNAQENRQAETCA